ncbi:LAETG motif-containing sortase-dependent surface protein [Streptomyces lavendulocolor]|uniref:LAETG motif-containing sortase-dependent surface protein n=1 Tax=Streptomyces lavendulocolor TaxID=67316 RepID=UPI003C2C78F7
MKIRRLLATAVVAAVTAPAALASVAPASAATGPAAPRPQVPPLGRSSGAPNAADDAARPSLMELEKAAAAARQAYDAAVAAEAAAVRALADELSDTAPLAVAAAGAVRDAEAAAAARQAAADRLADAEAALKDLPEGATEAEKARAEQDVADAVAAAEDAAEAQEAAGTRAKEATRARDDARAAASARVHRAGEDEAKALAAREAADKALADARKEAERGACVPEDRLTVEVTGLPATITAGTTVDFTVRVGNGTDRTLDEVWPYVKVEGPDDLLDVLWSTADSPDWQDADADHYAGAVEKLAAGAHAEVKVRLRVAASAPAGDGVATVAADYLNDDESCGGTPEFHEYGFGVVTAAPLPGPPAARPASPAPQTHGAAATRPLTTPAAGSLADTGSSSAVPQVAGAAATAVALGAGLILAVRRRRPGTGA